MGKIASDSDRECEGQIGRIAELYERASRPQRIAMVFIILVLLKFPRLSSTPDAEARIIKAARLVERAWVEKYAPIGLPEQRGRIYPETFG